MKKRIKIVGKNIAVMILGPLGDVINTSGIFKHLRNLYPDANISIITIDRALAAVQGIPEIDNVYFFDKSKSILNTIKFGLSLRGKFDTVIVLDNNLRAAYIAFLTGAKVRVGRGEQMRELFLTTTIPHLDEEKNLQIHVSEHYARCLIPLGIYKELDTYFSFKDEDEKNVSELLKKQGLENKKLIGICPACHLESKSLLVPTTAAIISKINKENKYKAVIIGGSDICDYVDELKEFSNIEYYDFSGKTKFLETAALIDKCEKFISVDTSCMHLALARKVPTTAIFFSKLFSKWGPKDLRRNNIIVSLDTKNIDVDKIMENVAALPEKNFN
ncbi:MAG: glycosyltransferase family 9 protein [Fusobacterium sp.]|nr:glycosyltransferase family 9 protein [Fusobacterium sp.]